MRSQEHLEDTFIRKLKPPAKASQVTYDDKVAGFGIRVTARGHRAFVFNYRSKHKDNYGQERRITIGDAGDWSTTAAREYAKGLRRKVDAGEDPMQERNEARDAATVADLCDRFKKEHLPRKRPGTQAEYQRAIDKDILPEWRNRKVASIEPEHVDALHRKITERGATYTANRVLAVVSKMFSLAIRWRMRTDNPCKGIERNQEHKRRRYLSPAELERLTKALAEHRDQQAANMIRLLLLTGARRGELQAMKWADVDIDTGTWTKPGATTKTKTDHQVPLSAPAKQLLAGVKRGTSEYVFPHNGSHRTEIKDNWAAVCKAAGITGARIHDCRHTYASILASAGQSLPIIGALLGHTQPSTTARYAHFFDDPLRAATERVGAIVTDQPTAEVVPLRRRRKVAK